MNSAKTLCFLIFFLPLYTPAQDSAYIDISKIGLSKNIAGYVSSGYAKRGTIGSVNLQPGIQHRKNVPASHVTSTFYLRFRVKNSSDSIATAYFFPGFYYKSIILYRALETNYDRLPDLLPDHSDQIGFRGIRLLPGDSAVILAEMQFARTYINAIRPRLVHPDFVSEFFSSLGTGNMQNHLMTFIFCGLLLMMILYSLANYMQGANKEFLYYSGYAFFIGFMLFTKAIFSFRATRMSYFFESYLDFVLQGVGIMFYMVFMQRFLETKKKYPFLYKFYNAGILMLLVSIGLYSFFHYFSDNFTIDNGIENATKLLLLLMVLVFLIYSWRKKNDKLMKYLFWGNLMLFIFSLASQIVIMNPALRSLPGMLGSSLFYYELGLLLELVLFLAGLNQKNRRIIIEQTREREELKAQNKLKEYEKELAVFKAQQSERERISADMHDELGSGMTAIRLMSEIAKNKMKENTPAELDRISASADDVLNKMNAIIWSMNSGNDSLDNLVSYIRSYAQEYFENTEIQCRVAVPDQVPPKEITGDKRRNIFLCVKETLHNALKHSNASQVNIEISLDDTLTIEIRDNGVGIDKENLREFGNGLKNIRKRMESIGGKVQIENERGTRTKLTLPI